MKLLTFLAYNPLSFIIIAPIALLLERVIGIRK